MKVYISGPITGKEDYEKVFYGAQNRLERLGLQVVNPADPSLGTEENWEAYMRRDIRLLLDCDAIYMLDGWKQSRGAIIEHNLASDLNMIIMKKR